ncbi:MAG TPA: hypothetical protein VMS73_07415 [Anaerolineaceae bacterium]|nr:hypothetical protein [Anaerolineaceae bacterium]
MRKSLILEITSGLILIVFFIFAISLIKTNQSKPNSQLILPPSQGIDTISARLKQFGVPIKQVDVLSTSPVEIKIVVQGSTNKDSAAEDDEWHLFLAEREATLAYLIGFKLDSYRIILLNINNEVISDSTTFLYSSDPSQQLSEVKSIGADNETVKELLQNRLILNRLKIITDQVTSDNIVRNNTKFVELFLSYPSNVNSTDESNDINGFVNSLRSSLFNHDFIKQTNISLIRVHINDSEGKFLLHFIYDVDTQSQSWAAAEGINGDWYPRPMVPKALLSATAFTATSKPTSTPARMGAYPPPGATPTPTTTTTPRPYP